MKKYFIVTTCLHEECGYLEEDENGKLCYAHEAEAEIASKRDTIEAAATGIAQRDARIAELEKRNERLERVNDAAVRYFVNWLQDEAYDAEICTEQEHRDAVALRDALENAPGDKAKQLADALIQLRHSL
jgi:hypothetical protein